MRPPRKHSLSSGERSLGVQLKDLRLLLRSAAHSEDGASLFKWLYRSWCHSLGAVLSLCFLSEVPASPAHRCLCRVMHVAHAPLWIMPLPWQSACCG